MQNTTPSLAIFIHFLLGDDGGSPIHFATSPTIAQPSSSLMIFISWLPWKGDSIARYAAPLYSQSVVFARDLQLDLQWASPD